MAVVEMPVRSDVKAYEFQIELDGVIYTLKFHFNSRAERWVMDIADFGGTELITGLFLLTNIDLNAQFVGEDIPPGRFILIDETGAERNPGFDDLGNDIKLLYEEALSESA